ncbi:unnamed protein product [Ilex paraguariensis]|uniref:RRM domain-containing protein n=1 Tax=Ilex paraguariensis TaxID=185542 RepID=A0ABC8RJG7_9AQUA
MWRSHGDVRIELLSDVTKSDELSIDHMTFRAQYPSVRGAKVVTDPNTGRSKGYGFVKFADEMERNRAMTEMNGVYCSTRPMRISAATPKKTAGFQQQYATAKGDFLKFLLEPNSSCRVFINLHTTIGLL